MKQKDILLIGVVVFITAIASFFISNALFASPKNRQQKVEIVSPITTEFNKPDAKFFNSNAVDPTKLIEIGNNPNPTPFSNKQ